MKQLLNRAELFDFNNATFYSLIESNDKEITLLNYKTKKNEIVSINRFNKLNKVPKKYSILRALFLGEKGNYKYLHKNKNYVFPTTDEYGNKNFSLKNKYTFTILDYLSLPIYWLKLDKSSRYERKEFRKLIKSLKEGDFPKQWTYNLNYVIGWVISEGLREYVKNNYIEFNKEDKAKILNIIKTFENEKSDQKDLDSAFKDLSKIYSKLWY